MATIDHVISRYSPDRNKPPEKGEVRRVLACRGCNQRREAEETERIKQENIAELWRRGNSYPLGHPEKDEIRGYRPSHLNRPEESNDDVN